MPKTTSSVIQSYVCFLNKGVLCFIAQKEKKEKGFCFLIHKKEGKYHVSMFSFGLNPPSPIKEEKLLNPNKNRSFLREVNYGI